MNTRQIFCTGCNDKVNARLTDGKEIYPHRRDLHCLPFWKCDTCKNYVGCHHKTNRRTKPLGVIPTPEIKRARQEIHKLIDPIWKSGRMDRNVLYKAISDQIGWNYHTANIRSLDEAREVYRIAKKIAA